MTRARHMFGWTACSLCLSLSAGAQAFVIDDSKVPVHNSPSQDVEFGDVDLDGDWDVVIGNGEEFSNWQSELWINREASREPSRVSSSTRAPRGCPRTTG